MSTKKMNKLVSMLVVVGLILSTMSISIYGKEDITSPNADSSANSSLLTETDEIDSRETVSNSNLSTTTGSAVEYNGNNYETLEKALEEVNATDDIKDAIKLKKDIHVDGITETGVINKSISLDLNGHKIYGNKTGFIIKIQGVSVTLGNGTPASREASGTADGIIENLSPVVGDRAIAVDGGQILFAHDVEEVSADTVQKTKTINLRVKKFKVTTELKCGGVDGNLAGAVSPAIGSVFYGGSLSLTVNPAARYRIKSISLNGTFIERTKTINLSNIREDTKIVVTFERPFMLLIDPGHGANEINQVGSYKEHEAMWALATKLKSELEKYEGILVDLTKNSQDETPGVVARGLMAAGYDLLISMHSNWSSSKDVDYALAIVSSGVELNSKAAYVGEALANTIKEVMNLQNPSQLWTKKQNDGSDWYGVIRGAASVGTPAIILEHSFHSNDQKRWWLQNPDNLSILAKKEAETIGAYYGLFRRTMEAAPIGLEAKTVSTTEISLNWRQSQGISGYSIYRSTSPEGIYAYCGSTRDTEFKDSGLTHGTTYYYKIKTYTWLEDGSAINGQLSEMAIGVTHETIGRPTNLTGKVSSNSISLIWDAVVGASGYNIYRSEAIDGVFAYVGSTTKTSYTNSGLNPSSSYYYKIKAYAWIGDGRANVSKNSDVLEFKTLGVVDELLAPKNLSGLSNENTVYFSWDEVEGASGYNIYYSANQDGPFEYIGSTQRTGYSKVGLEPNTNYYYRIRAYTWIGGGRAIASPNSQVIGIKTKEKIGLLAPVISFASPNRFVWIRWSGVEGATGYVLYRANSITGPYEWVKTLDATTCTTGDQPMPQGKVYYYRVKAFKYIDGRPVFGPWSTPKGVVSN